MLTVSLLSCRCSMSDLLHGLLSGVAFSRGLSRKKVCGRRRTCQYHYIVSPVSTYSSTRLPLSFQGVYNIPFLPTLTQRLVDDSQGNIVLVCLLTRRTSCRIDEIAKKRGKTMAQISMAWVLSKPWVSAPVIGATKLSNIEGILGEHYPSSSHILRNYHSQYLQTRWRSLSRKRRSNTSRSRTSRLESSATSKG